MLMGMSGLIFCTHTKRVMISFANFDGDGQHRAEELSKILKSVIEGNAHLVIGSRPFEKKVFQSTFYRRIGISVFSLLS